MATRNFWIVADIDGRERNLEGGPRRIEGGMDVTLYVRDEGGRARALEIICRAQRDGKLTVDVSVKDEKHLVVAGPEGFYFQYER